MNLVHYNPNRRVNLRSNGPSNIFDTYFDDFFSPVVHQRAHSTKNGNRQFIVDIYEKDDSVFIDAELPGVEKENISVDVKGKSITLSAERTKESEVNEEQSYRRERQYGTFTRSFSLPFELSDDGVTATYRDGLLKLKIAKPAEQTIKKIEIN